MSFAALLAFTVAAMGQFPHQATPRHETIARAIADEAALRATSKVSPVELAAWSVMMTWRESNWFLSVHNGTKLGDDGESYCLMQVKRNRVFAPNPKRLLGVDYAATRRCVAAGMRAILYHHRRCGRGMRGAIAGYMTGHACSGFGSARFEEYQSLLRP